MPARTNCNPDEMLCTCGAKRAIPVDTVGMPPIGTVVACLSCWREWTLVEKTIGWGGGTRLIWASEDPPVTDIKAANDNARMIEAIDAALTGLGLLHGTARGQA